MSEHKNIAAAMAAAQAEMKAPAKTAENPAFKKDGKPTKYADLDAVVESVRGPLTKHGISWRHEMEFFGDQMCMTTYAEHGASDTHRKCPVPLFVDRNNMHGLKSAITYAKRIGLESVTGQAPGDDDDGNAAAESPGKSVRAAPTVSPDQYIKLRDLAAEAGISEADVCAKVGAPSLEQFPASKFDAVAKGLQKKIDAAKPSPSEQITDDEVPY